ncbi:esterase-like activity of phytase family protein [Kitasatospora sp. NPDC057015]|uniref:esterase-like activity of phytase family protein n=1 Tax=Kitasatospora sp. NPDC057015 TaxID=3346001 RepID=UPI00363D565D
MRISRLLPLAAAALVALTPAVADAATSAPVHDGSWTYRDPAPLGGDRGLSLGGFSDLFPADDSGTVFWTLTDRGPNADAAADTDKVFLKPDYTPQILKIKLRRDGSVDVLKRIPLQVPKGQRDPVTGTRFLTGLPPAALTAERPIDTDGRQLPNDPYGLDSEGLVRAHDGSFWVSSEYGSSILHFSARGVLQSVLVPAGSSYQAPGVEVLRILPAVEAKQKNNKGLEGLTVSADGRTLYAAQQTSLSNPDAKSTKKSRVQRIFRIDIGHRTPVVTGEFANVREADSATDGGWATSAISWLGPDRLLVEERDGARPTAFTKFFEVDLRRATDLLGSVWDDPATTPSLEVAPTGTTGVVPGTKRLVFDAVAAGLDNGKLEGVALRPAGHGTAELFLVNDNDFGVDGFKNGAVVPNNAVTRVDRYVLPAGTVSFGR